MAHLMATFCLQVHINNSHTYQTKKALASSGEKTCRLPYGQIKKGRRKAVTACGLANALVTYSLIEPLLKTSQMHTESCFTV